MSRSNTAENAKLMYEAGQTYVPMAALSDSGDHTTFTSAGTLWSNKSGKSPTVRPNGLVSGGAVSVGSGDNNVAVAALTCYLAGVLTSVSADSSNTVTRATPTDTHIINSITITAAGAIAVVAGTGGTAFSETRGAAGGPPFIAVDAIEIAQIRLSSSSAAPVESSEIFSVVGTHVERYDYPLWEENYNGGSVTFADSLPLIHTGSVPKAVYAEYNTPIFSEVSPVTDFVPPENTHSVSSTPVYGGAIGASASSLNQGSFTAYMQDGVTDGLVLLKNQELWFKFYPDRNKAPYLLCQGKLGISRTFPAGSSIAAKCTISASEAGSEVSA